MKVKLAVFVLAASLVAFGQGRGRGMGGSMGQGGGMGQGAGMGDMGQGASMGHGQGQGQVGMDRGQGKTNSNGGMDTMQQRPLKDAQINGGAFRMLEKKTGMTADQLKQMYASSGAKNFGQFASALVVSKNLNLDPAKVLAGLKTQSLGKTIQSLGVDQKTASAEIRKAHKEVRDADATKDSDKG